MNIKKRISLLLAVVGILSVVLVAVPAFAQTSPGSYGGVRQGGRTGGQPGVFGTVTSVNGTTLTVTSKGFEKTATATTYTVDTTNATVTKNNAASTVADIAVGDTIMIQGTVSGTSVTATTIRDGVAQPQTAIQGNGQPVTAGSVTSISGNIITITNASNVTYTVDATNAKFSIKGVTSPTISNIAVGDNLTVQGTVSGTSVTASSVIDQKPVASNNTNKTASNPVTGFIGGITNFFKHLFGF